VDRPVLYRNPCDGLAVPEWPRLRLSPAQMHEVGIAKAGLLRIPATPELAYEFLQVRWRTIQHYGVEVDGLRYNGEGLDLYRNQKSPYSGVRAGKWPIRVNPDDVRCAWFQDPAGGAWHRLDWEHAAGLGTPFSAEAALHARRLAARQGGWPDQARALEELLARWDQGVVTGRRERGMAARLAAERAALPAVGGPRPDPAPDADAGDGPGTAALPGAAELPGAGGDDDDPAEIFDEPEGGGFYDDAFEVLE
jgi:Mu transposase, C-terminal